MSETHTKHFRTAKSETIRSINSTLILNVIRNNQPISRAEVARRTGLQRSTISEIFNDLLKKELLVEIGEGLSSGGRKPTMMRLNAERFCVFGVSIGVQDIDLAMSDLNGHIIYKEAFPVRETPEELFKVVAEKINRIIHARRSERLHYEGIGISVRGMVDYSTGEILFAPNMGWRHVRVEDYLKVGVPVPIYVDNDANAAALAEAWYDPNDDSSPNLVLVLVTDGVGVGMVIDGEIYRGANGTAGEFGHMVIVAGGEKCRCGNSGCWEVYASDDATLARYAAPNSRGEGRAGLHVASGRGFSITVSELIARARNGDASARHTLREAARYIGIGIGNILSGLNPYELVISGQIIEGWELIEPAMKAAIARSPQHDLTRTTVRRSNLGSDGALMGAVALAISRRFSFKRVGHAVA